MKNLVKLSRRYLSRRKMIALVLVSILCVFKDLGGVIALASATDAVIAGSGVKEALLLMGIVMVSGIIIFAVNHYIEGRIVLNMKQALLKDFEKKLCSIRMEELDSIESGKLLSNYTGDIQRIGTWFEKVFPKIIQLGFYLTGALIYSFCQSVGLTLSVVPAVAIAMPLLLHIVKRLDTSVNKERKAADQSIQKIGEILNGLEFIKTYHLESVMEQKIDGQLKIKEEQDYQIVQSKASMNAASYIISYLPGIFAGIVGGWYLFKGYITVGFLIGFIQMMMGRIAYVFPQFGSYLASSREADIYSKRILSYLEKRDELQIGSKQKEKTDVPVIQFSHVHFTYPGRKEILSDISFSVYKGEKIAFMGPSGCGKSTILKLILGYYADQYEGSIQVLGKELRDWQPGELRKRMAPVFQDNLLFAGTVRENLAMLGSEEKVESVIKTMQFTKEFTDSVVGNDGIMLSGGQRQRVAIARGLMKSADVYLFDEPTASLDHITQIKLSEELKQVLKDQTQIFVEHRYEAVADADRIYYL